jgi:predicted nucleic acid-binding protein
LRSISDHELLRKCYKTRPMPDYIFDTTVLSNLAAVGRLELLEKRYGQVALTTVEVSDELRRGLQAGYGYLGDVLQQVQSANSSGWLRIAIPESATEHQLRGEFDLRLDPGEASCLALAISRGLILVTDDLAARQLAQERDVLLTGTVGILLALVRDGSLPLSEGNTLLAEMIQRRYRSPVDHLDELI